MKTDKRAALSVLSLLVIFLFASFYGNKAEATNVCGTISTNTTWSVAGSPYILTCDVTIASTATVTVEPGVTVKVNGDRGLTVNGTLLAIGTAENRITFTSSQATPTAGYWRRLTLSSSSQLSYVTVSYGGKSISPGSIYLNGTAPTMDNIRVEYSGSTGIYVINTTVNLDQVTTVNNSTGVNVEGASNVTITNSALSSNSNYGLDIAAGAQVSISNSSLSNNSSYAIRAQANGHLNSVSEISLYNNGSGTKNGVVHGGGTSTSNEVWCQGIVHFMLNNVTVGSTGSLTIEPGVTVKVSASRILKINGTLTTAGTVSNPITFTTDQTTPTKGYWGGIWLNSGSSGSSITNTTVSYGGYYYNANIYITDSSASLDRVTFSNSSASGLRVSGVSNPTIQNCIFTGNTNGLVNDTTTNVVSAKLNYWGSSSGPSGSGPGTGQLVSAGVTYDPWLTAFPSNPQFFTSGLQINRISNPGSQIYFKVNWTTALEGNWKLTVTNSANTVIRTILSSAPTASGQALWDGRNDAGAIQQDGTYTYKLENTTEASQSATPLAGKAILDSNRQLTIALTMNPDYVSPNGNGVQDTATATATFTFDDADWTLEIRNSMGIVVRSETGIGPGIVNYTWDGKDSNDVVQPDGVYTFDMIAHDGTQTAGATSTVTLDNTLPIALISSPAQGIIASNVYLSGSTNVPVVGTASDTNFSSWTLQYGSGGSPSSWTTIGTGTTPKTDTTIATWATGALTNSTYTLRLTSSDRAGNTVILPQTLSLGNFSASQTGLQINSISTGTVTYTSNVPFTLTESVYIKNSQGQVVRTLFNQQRSAGTYNDTWNGRDDAGNVLPDGVYYFYATATEGSSSMTWDVTSRYVNDTTEIVRVTGEGDPFRNLLIPFTYTFSKAGKIIMALRTDWAQNLTSIDCSNSNWTCIFSDFQQSGTFNYPWAGVDSTGRYREDATQVLFYSTRADFSKNAVVLFGTRPTVSALQITPYYYSPGGDDQAITFTLATYQNQSAAVTTSILNQDSLTTIRALTNSNVSPGQVSMSWDGKAGDGKPASPGWYTITLLITDALGNQTTAQGVMTIYY